MFNSFVSGRESTMARAFALVADFRRLNQRLHNKLFVADGAVAIVGGRQLANEYFVRGTEVNFIDFALLVTGAVLPACACGW